MVLVVLQQQKSSAQKVVLTNSSATHWSGGIAGRYGVGYNFTVTFSAYHRKEPAPDTLWIGNKCIPLIIKTGTNPQPFNATRTQGKKSVAYTIFAGTSHEDDLNNVTPYPGQKKITPPPEPAPPIKYSGIALLSYQYKGKQHYFVIDKIMKNNPPVNYP